jgi:hypothetical protein
MRGQRLVPGKPAKSLLMHSVRYEDEDLQMPPKSKLPAEDIRILEQWIAMGAPDPRVESMAAASRRRRLISRRHARAGRFVRCKKPRRLR